MTLEALAKIFPIKMGLSDDEKNDLNFENDGKAFHIAKKDLTHREQQLFQDVLFASQALHFDQLAAGTYRIIQLKSDELTEIVENLSLIFPSVTQMKRLSTSTGLAIEKLSADHLTEAEVKHVLSTLTQDLGVKCDYYIGLFTDRASLEEQYQIEADNFKQGLTFSEALLKAGLNQVISPPLSKIKQALLTDLEAQDLIRQLYRHDGNQLKTATDMYIHRNTLTLRIKKFERQYGLTLNGSDLVLLYSLLA